MHEPMLSFVVPVRNDATRLARCLASIKATAEAIRSEVVVVDNGSTDGSADVAAAAGCRVLVIPHERVGALRNRGAAAASGALLAFVDADHEVSREWASAALDVMQDEAVAATGYPYFAPEHATWVQRTYDGLRDRASRAQPVEWLGSGNLVVRRDVFARIGGFDESLEACEDVDLCRRLRAEGATIVSDPRLRSVHFGDPATLSALFTSELWRGRNNLRVSLRERPSLRGLPSLLIPVWQLALSAASVAAAIISPPLAGVGIAAIALPSLLRAERMRRRSGAAVHHAIAVAFTYDAARALALVLRTPHRRAAAPLVALPR